MELCSRISPARYRGIYFACGLLWASSSIFAAGVEVDGASATGVDAAANGVPVVNIAQPNDRGLSHNTYKHFNVDPSGLILNNANQNVVNTQLGGQIFGNANLIAPAKVILNEVTSTHRSLLQGYTEVAGQTADVVIANPNGLSINGAGFINSSRVTLTTGRPIIDTFGNLGGFDVRGGDLSISGSGLDTQQQDATSIYTHFLNLNAKLHAKDLDVALGHNEIDYPGRKVKRIRNSGAKRVVLDSTALGGIYANKIKLVGTDKGLGMNLPPEVIASSGDIHIASDGRLQLQKLDAAGDIRLLSNADIDSNDTVFSAANLDIFTRGDFNNNSGLVAATAALSVDAGQITNDGNLLAGLNRDGSLNDYGYLSLSADTLSNRNTMTSTNRLNLRADEIINQGIINASKYLTLNADRLVNEATLFSGGDADLFVASELYNDTDATIFTVDNLTLAANVDHDKTSQITNHLGLIQSLRGDITIFAQTVDNIGSAELDYDLIYYDLGNGREVASLSQAQTINLSYHSGYTKHRSKARRRWVDKVLSRLASQAPLLYSANAGAIRNNRAARFTAIETRMVDRSTTTPGVLDSGRDLNLHVDNYSNENSVTAASGDINLDIAGSYRNIADSVSQRVTDYQYYTSAKHKRNSRSDDRYSSKGRSGYASVSRTRTVSANTVTQAGGSINGSVGGTLINDGVGLSSGQLEPIEPVNPSEFDVSQLQLPTNDFGLFVASTSPDSDYLIETNPQFTDYETFISSDYLFDRLDFSATDTIRRLGDGFYETQWIRDSVFDLSGQRYLNASIKNDQQQFQYLMDNAVAVQQQLDLAPGIALSADQLNRLTRDIVWLETEVVDGQPVLIPRVYLASGRGAEVQGGKLIAGVDTQLQVASLDNRGVIEASRNIQIDAGEAIQNQGSMQAGNDLTLGAEGDIENVSGRIKGGTVAITSRDGSIINRRATEASAYAASGVSLDTTIVSAAGVIEADDDVSLTAADRMVVQGSQVRGGQVSLQADTVEITTTSQSDRFFAGDKKNHFRESSHTHFASSIDGNDIVILSQDRTQIRGSTLTANADLRITAAELDIAAVNEQSAFSSLNTTKGTLSKTIDKRKRIRSRNHGSELNAATVVLVTEQGDIELTGSRITADNQLALASAGGIRINAGHDGDLDESHRSKSGWFSGGSLYSETEDLEGRIAQTAVGSQLRGASVQLDAVDAIELTGVDIAATDRVTASAQDISVRHATSEETTYSKHTKIRVGFDDVAKNLTDIDDLIESEDGKLSLTLADARYDNAESVTTQTRAQASQIQADDIVFSAGLGSGDADRNSDATIAVKAGSPTSAGDILIEGSNLIAEQGIELSATGEVALLDAHEVTTRESKSQSGTAELKLTLKNEYDQAVRAVKAVKQAERELRQAQRNYTLYQRELDSQEAQLQQLRKRFASGEGFIEQADIDDFKRHLDRLRDDKEYYRANIALATTTLTSKTTALIQQTGKAAQSSASYGFNLGLELDIDAVEKQLDEYYSQSIASNLVADRITITAGETATVRGSTIQANESIDIAATEIDIQAGESRSNTRQNEQQVQYGYNWDLLGGGDPTVAGLGGNPVSQVQNLSKSKDLGGNASTNDSSTEGETRTFSNAQLQANNIRITAAGDTTIAGATIHADDQLDLSTENLDVKSVQHIDYTETRSQGLSYSGSGGGINAADSHSETVQTQVTSLTGTSVNIGVDRHTELQGAVIAAIDADGTDNGQLSLSTGTLAASSLNNTIDNSNRSLGVNVGETATLDYQNDAEHSKTKTLATLGHGDIEITDTDGSSTRMLNTDLGSTEVAVYDLESHQSLSGELDTRLLSESGRDQIAEDWLKTGMIGNTLKLIVTTDKVGIDDFFDETEKHHTTYETVKQEIRNDPTLAAMLQDATLNAEQKAQMLDQLTNAVMVKLGYDEYSNNLIATDNPGRDNQPILGFYSTETGQAYINDQAIDDTAGLVTAAGHEATRAMDDQENVDFDQDREDRTRYAENYGASFAEYTDQALDINGYDAGLAQSNHHVGNNSTNVAESNQIFANLDKTQGDNYLDYDESHRYRALLNSLYDCDAGGGCSEQQEAEWLPEVVRFMKQDDATNARLAAACRSSASSDACRAEAAKVRDAFYSYKNSTTPITADQSSDYFKVAIQYGEFGSLAMEDGAKRALVSMPIDTATGLVDLTAIGVKAGNGDAQAQAQLAAIGKGIQAFITNPIDTIEQGIVDQLAEADRLEALGDINQADQIRSRIVLEGAFAVVGAVDGTLSLVRALTRVPDLKGVEIKAGNFDADIDAEVGEIHTIDPATYRVLAGVGADGTQLGLPKNYSRVVAPNGDIVIRGPSNRIYQPTDFVDQAGNPLYSNNGKLYSLEGKREYVRASDSATVKDSSTVDVAASNDRLDSGVVPDKNFRISELGNSEGYSPFDLQSVGAAKVNVKVPGYGWKDNKWWKTVERLKTGESIQVKNMRIAAELRKDAFPDFARTKYRGNLSEAPDLTKTYDWHNPQKMIHPGPHQTPHVQMKLENGKWVRIEVKSK